MTAGVRVRALVLLALLTLAASACGAGNESGDDSASPEASQPAEELVWEDGVLQPLSDGFPDGRLTLLNADDPGSADGLYVRTMQRALADLSPVPVEVVDRPLPDFGTWAGLDFIRDQRGGSDGYYSLVASFIGAGLDFLTEPITPELGYTIDDMNPVIATEFVPFVVMAPADATYDTWEELVQEAHDRPGELRYISLGVGSGLDIPMERLMALEEMEVNKIPLNAPVDVGTTIAAGEGDFAMIVPDIAIGEDRAGNVKVLLIVGDEAPSPWEDVTTTADLGLDEPWGSLRGFIVPPEVPQAHREWLYELYAAAAEEAPYQERIANVPGAVATTQGHDEVLRNTRNAIDLAEPIVQDLGLHWEDQ